MSKTKIIGLFGVGQTDICLYTASVLQNLGFKVAVSDNSYEQLMRFCIPKPAEKIQTITYKNIDYERLVPPESWDEKEYDFLIVDLGVWPGDDALRKCDEIFLVMDCMVAQLFRYRELMIRMALPMNVILRDICRDAVSSTAIFKKLSEENPYATSFYEIPLDEDDVTNRIIMQYRGYNRFLHMSLPFEKLILNVVRNLTGAAELQLLKSFKRAKRGECA